MRVKVELRLMDIHDKLQLEVEKNTTVESLLERPIQVYGENLSKLIRDAEKGFNVIVIANGEVVKFGHGLKDKEELLLLLPTSGG